MSRFVEFAPGGARHDNALAFWLKTAPTLTALSTAIDDIQIAPYGVACNIVPLISPRRNATGIIALGGHDLFNASSPLANRRPAAILGMVSQKTMLEGPKSLLLPTTTPCTGACTVDPLLGILARQAMFVAQTEPYDVWAQNTSWPGVLPGQVLGPFTGVRNCSGIINPVNNMSYCDTNATGDGRRFWGFSTVIVMWKQLLQLSRVTDLGDASMHPYKWSVSRSTEASLGVPPFTWVYISSNAGRLPEDGTPGYTAGETTQVSIFTSVWSFTVEKPGGWRPAWEHGVIAGVVCVSFVIAVFAFQALLERNLHLSLLYSMLPKRMVQKMNSGGFAESFDHVVVLFSASFAHACTVAGARCCAVLTRGRTAVR